LHVSTKIQHEKNFPTIFQKLKIQGISPEKEGLANKEHKLSKVQKMQTPNDYMSTNKTDP